MENGFPEFPRLYGVLDREVGNGRLELADNIHMVPLYKDTRATTGSQEKIFDPIGQTSFNSAVGFWCITPLFYDERGTAMRKVPEGKGSWELCNTFPTLMSEGEKWFKQKLRFKNKENARNFTMMQYMLGDKGDQPMYAICKISRSNEGAARNRRLPDRGQKILPQNQVVLPGGTAGARNEIDRGSSSGTKGKAIGEPEANLNKRKRLEIEDPSDSTRWPIENDHMAKTLTTLLELLQSRNTLQIRDPSDGSEWTIDNGQIIESLRVFRSDPDQSTGEIRQSNVAPPNTRIEDNQSTTPVQASQHGAAGTPNDSAMRRDPNLRQPYMPAQQGLHTNNQDNQQNAISETNDIFEEYVQFLNMDIENQNVIDLLYDMENQRNAHIIDPFYAPGESSTHYNQGFSDDDHNISDVSFD